MDENLFGNTAACKRLEVLEVAFARGASSFETSFASIFKAVVIIRNLLYPAAASSWSHALEPLDKKISKYIGGNPIRLDGKPRASGVFDTVSIVLYTASMNMV